MSSACTHSSVSRQPAGGRSDPFECSNLFFGASSSKSTLSLLQERHQISGNIFINQNDSRATPRNGGSCGPTCAVNLLQGLRESVGLGPESRPYEVIGDLFEKLPAMNQGNVTPQSMHEAIEFLIDAHVPGRGIRLQTEMIDGLDPRRFSWKDVQLVNQLTAKMVIPRENENKILLFGIIKPDGSFANGHYVLVRDYMDSRIEVIEPNKPESKMQFYIEPTKINKTLPSVELFPGEGNIFHGHFESGTRFVLISFFTTGHQ